MKLNTTCEAFSTAWGTKQIGPASLFTDILNSVSYIFLPYC